MEKSPDAFRTISEVAEILDTPAHVLRFWESRFPQVRPVKRAGGRRYYRPSDVALLSGIRTLLHDQGLTIRGVQKILREQGVRHVALIGGGAVGGALAPGDADLVDLEAVAEDQRAGGRNMPLWDDPPLPEDEAPPEDDQTEDAVELPRPRSAAGANRAPPPASGAVIHDLLTAVQRAARDAPADRGTAPDADTGADAGIDAEADTGADTGVGSGANSADAGAADVKAETGPASAAPVHEPARDRPVGADAPADPTALGQGGGDLGTPDLPLAVRLRALPRDHLDARRPALATLRDRLAQVQARLLAQVSDHGA